MQQSSQTGQTSRSRLIAQIGQRKNAVSAISRRRDPSSAPLTFSQERLWIMSQLETANPIYNVAGALEFDGALNTETFGQCLDEVLRRHDILRSRFVNGEQGSAQRVMSEMHLKLSFSDLTESAIAERNPDWTMDDAPPNDGPPLAYFKRYAETFIRRPFALSQQPPVRAMLAKLDTGRHAFVLVLHHIVGDRWSVGILMKEVAALYHAYVNGLPSPLTALPIQFGDYAAWQRQQETSDQHLDYWRTKLDGAPPLLELPTDRPRPPVNRYRGETYRFDFRPELRQRLAEFGKRENATLFMTMAAALSVLLFRYSGNKDINIGYPVAGRNAVQTTALIGFFVNTLILRNCLDPAWSFSELLARIKEQALSDLEHQNVAFGQMIESLNPVRDAGHTPLFQVMLAVQNVPSATLRLPHLYANPINLDNAIAQFDLTLFIDEDQTRLQGGFEYNTDLFERSTVALLADRLQELLADCCRNPAAPLCNLNLLSSEERQQVLCDFNHTRKAFAKEPFIHRLFETQVERTPDACALVFAGQTLSYAQLNRRANRLAHYLSARGLRAEDRVAVFFERSFDMVVSLLGILKASAAYVPVDPDYPAERLIYLFEDCRPSLLITSRAMRARLPDAIGTTVPVIELDGDAYRSAAETLPERNPDPKAMGLTPKHLAYLIYTSGSTGRPKGAMNEHAAVVNRLLWAQQEYRLNAEDRILQKTPYSFDVSVWEFFLPLISGAVLVLAKPKGHQEPDYLMDLIEVEAVTTLHFVPSMLQAFMSAVNAEKCRSLRQILCSGEALPRELVQRVRADLPFVELHNLYGPTEAAIDVTAWSCRQEPTGAVPIGYPIANTAIHILDPFLNPVPVGVPGEIHIGGLQVGRGYFDKPDLTAERFIPDPFRIVEGSTRLYKTGDLARWLADGAIEYLGRNDFQVKLRGFRIELGEIEAKLKDYPGIRDALATVREDDAHGKRLVAYLLNHDGIETPAAELRVYLAKVLPEYMVPNVFVALAEWPLTTSGKIDRDSLPMPGAGAVVLQRYEAPQNEIEATLAGIWQELLSVEKVGRNDHFFELGGHSLMALDLAERLRTRGLGLEAREVFSHPVLASLATVVAQSRTVFTAPPNLIPEHFGQSSNEPDMEEFRI